MTTTMPACDALRATKELLGENGERWAKGAYQNTPWDFERGEYMPARFCLMGALGQITRKDPYEGANWRSWDEGPDRNAAMFLHEAAAKFAHEKGVPVNADPDFDSNVYVQYIQDHHASFADVTYILDEAIAMCIEAASV